MLQGDFSFLNLTADKLIFFRVEDLNLSLIIPINFFFMFCEFILKILPG